MEIEIGTKIRINHLKDENDLYDGTEGVVEHIDSIGQLWGTWGSLAVIPDVDDYEVI